MRILYHHRSLADGAEGIHIAAMTAAFESLGHRVEVRGLGVPAGDSRKSALASTLRRRLPDGLFEVAAIAANLPECLEVLRSIRRFQPAFLYKRHARHDIGALLAARRARVPSVLEVNSLFSIGAYHDFEPLHLRRAGQSLERRALRLATVVAAVSTPLARQCEELSGREVIVLPNGVDPERFDQGNGERVRERLGLGAALTIGWAGILRQWHGLELLLDALSALPLGHLLIVGDGPARPAIEKRIRELGLSSRILITGRVPHERMPDYISAMDIAVVADERTGVASPMKLLEYMAMRRAVVAPHLPNVTDLIDQGVDGVLFRPGDACDLVRALREVGSDSGLRKRLGEAARQKIERERNWVRNARVLLSIIE